MNQIIYKTLCFAVLVGLIMILFVPKVAASWPVSTNILIRQGVNTDESGLVLEQSSALPDTQTTDVISHTVYLPFIVSSGSNGIYTDHVNGYSLKLPGGWTVSEVTPSEGVGGVTVLSEASGQAKIEIGVEIYDRPRSVSLEDWVTPNSDLALSLQLKEKLNLPQGVGIIQTYVREGWSGKIVYVPFGLKVVFVQLIPADPRYNDALMQVVSSITYPTSEMSAQPETARLYPETTRVQPDITNFANMNFNLPFSGKAKITQTGNGGLSHNCPGWDCQALDFSLSVNGMDGRVYAAEAGTVIFYGQSPNGYGNLIEILHSNGYVSWYAHLKALGPPNTPPSTPSSVKRGQWLGMEGQTGCSGSPYYCPVHLHFMIKNGPNLDSSPPIDISHGLLPRLEFTPCSTDTNCGWAYGGPSLYQGSQRTGWSQTMDASISSLGDEFIGNDQVSSVWVPQDWSLLLYPDVNFGGNPIGIEYFGSGTEGGTTFNSFPIGISSIKVGYLICPSGFALSAQSCFPSTPIPPTVTPPSGQQVKLFGLANYQNLLWSGGVGFSNQPNANTYSMDIPGGWSVKTWRGDNRSGEERCWSESVANLQDHGWHLAIQSIEVFNSNVCPLPSGVYLYRNTGYGGASMSFSNDAPSLGNAGFGNDEAESIQISGDWLAVLFGDDNYGGPHSVFNGSDSNLSDNTIGNNQASSIRVRRRNPAYFTLYERGDWNGASFPSDRTITDLGQWDFNDFAESIRVASGYEVVVCEHSDFHGACGRTNHDVGDLNAVAQGLRRGASSVRVCVGRCPDAPNPPTLISPVNGASFTPGTPISFQWSGNGDKYLVEVWGGALSSPQTYGFVDSLQWTKMDLPASSTPYNWSVKAWNGYGESGWGNTWSFTITDATPTPTWTPTPTATFTPTPTPTSGSGVELLSQPWHLVGNNGAAEAYQSINPNVLQGKNMVRITYNLHGLIALGNDASAIIFDQNGWRYISLSNYGQNGKDGIQTVDIPLSQFPGLNLTNPVGTLHTRFWYSGPFVVDITSIMAYTSSGGTITPTPTWTPTPTATFTPTPTPTSGSGVELLSQPWHLVGNNGAAEAYQSINPNILQGKNTLRITYNLHGLSALTGDASAIIFDQNGWRYISLSNYGQNGKDGVQTIDIPLSQFPGLNLNNPVGTLHTRFWYSGAFVVDITSIKVY